MTLTTDIVEAESDQLRGLVKDLPRDRGEYIRAAKAYLDCVVMIQKFGPLPEGFCHAGWPWSRHYWQPDRFDAQKNVTKAAALMFLEFERMDEQQEGLRSRRLASA